MPLHLYNSLSKSIQPFTPRDPRHVSFYSCGPTVYDDAHVGNFRSFLAADVLRRWIESPLCALANDPEAGRGLGKHAAVGIARRTVTHVMNITDVGHMTDDAEGGENGEDRMAVAGRRLLEAKKSGALPAGVEVDAANPYQIADFYATRFLEDARRLGLKVALEAKQDPTLMPRPTGCIPQMIAMIELLIARGHAYAVGAPQRQVVYFDVQSFPAYGQLSGNTLDKLRSGAGGRIDQGNQSQKKHPADFLLWKADPAHIMKWDSPWGPGYPGWHIECSVMAEQRLAALDKGGDGTIDLHSGGEDNVFPHHECEIAQTCGCTGNPVFARTWFHPRHLFIEGAKMSKSKGNFYTARQLMEQGIELGALRLELIKTHYRTNANFTMQGLADSQRMLQRWRRVAAAAGATAMTGAELAAESADAAVLEEFAELMNDDLNVAGALGLINSWTGDLTAPTASDAAALSVMDDVLGVLSLERLARQTMEIGVYLAGTAPSPEVEERLLQRRAAREKKDFKRSDTLRDELAALGYAIKDMAGGRVEISRLGGR
ncbi:cysteine--tRNA ligase [soil metagenome]